MTYTHTSIPYPSPHDTHCRDCQRPIAQGEQIRRRVIDSDRAGFDEMTICGEDSPGCTLNQGGINFMQEELRRDRLDERIAELEAECERLRASEETVRLLAEVIRVSDDTLMRKRIAELEEELLHGQQDVARIGADIEDAEQQRDVLARQLSELLRDHAEVSKEMMKARKQAGELRDQLAQVRQAVNVPGAQLTADPDWQVAAVRAIVKNEAPIQEPSASKDHAAHIDRERAYQAALERELTHDEYDCNDLECTRHGWRAKE